MRRSAATLLLAALLLAGGAAALNPHRALLAPTPTQKLNADRQAQQQAQSQAAAAQAAAKAQAAARRLAPPCFVPVSYYPVRACGVSSDASTCGRGFNAWKTYEQCCARQRGPLGAFPEGCTNTQANLTCWVPGDYHPRQTCRLSSDFSECNRNWGRWDSEAACCAPGAAHGDGCSRPEPCWVADRWWPERGCGQTEDQAVCSRGWGAYASEADCCAPGAAFSDACGPAAGAAGAGADADGADAA